MNKRYRFYIIPILFVLLYFTRGFWLQWLAPDFVERHSVVIQTYGALLTIGSAFIAFLFWFFARHTDSSQPSNDSTHPKPTSIQSLTIDTDYEPTPLDDTLTLDTENPPYLGLGAFRIEDAHLFFGRRREVREALSSLGRPLGTKDGQGENPICRWLQIEGNSGAGKSSLVNAGLLPAIKNGKLNSQTGYKHWQIIKTIMPGEAPLKRLAEALEQTFVTQPEKRDTLARQQRLETDGRALSYMLNDYRKDDTAFVLFVDQFEELFTFAGKQEKKQFDAQLSYALKDKDCPLFLITTVRIDFLEGFEQLVRLSELYNRYCKRYLLKTISLEGLKEAIQRPAAMVGLDVSEVSTAILQDAEGEVGALPLVENALQVLWQQRQGNKLSGEVYLQKGRLVGLLEEQADALLNALDRNIPKGKHCALELLLALTRISDEGRHTRRNLSLGEACLIAGGKKADRQHGLKIIDYLTGRQATAVNSNNGRLRLLTTIGENEKDQQVSIIHETLIRARGKDKITGKLVGYWKTLYDFIEKHRNRGFYRDQLTRQAERWQTSHGLGCWSNLASLQDLKHYKHMRLEKGSVEAGFKRRSQLKAGVVVGLLAVVLVFVGESYYWTLSHSMPPGYMLMQQKFRLMDWGLMDEPLPEMVEIAVPQGSFIIGEQDDEFAENANRELNEGGSYLLRNFGYPNKQVEISSNYAIGKYEVTHEEYDYYIWRQLKRRMNVSYPGGAGANGSNNRGRRAVAQVSWIDANAYLHWLSVKTGARYRLPTEAEWEAASRAGSTTAYWWGDDIKKDGEAMANCEGCGSSWDNKSVAPVGHFEPNSYGLYDTSGNVWEWTCSEWRVEFDKSNSESVCASENKGQRVVRGGSWINETKWSRSSARFWYFSGNRTNYAGFRVYRAARTN